MRVDIDDLRADLERLCRKTEETLAEEEDETLRAMHLGTLIGYAKVEVMLNEMEKVYRERESECVRGSREKGYEE